MVDGRWWNLLYFGFNFYLHSHLFPHIYTHSIKLKLHKFYKILLDCRKLLPYFLFFIFWKMWTRALTKLLYICNISFSYRYVIEYKFTFIWFYFIRSTRKTVVGFPYSSALFYRFCSSSSWTRVRNNGLFEWEFRTAILLHVTL